MEFDLNKGVDCETIEVGNFSIRKYVAGVREGDPEKCWPFESVCDYEDFDYEDEVARTSQLLKSISLLSHSIREGAEALELSEVEISKGKEFISETETETVFGVKLFEVNKSGSETPTAIGLQISEGNKNGSQSGAEFQLEVSKGKGIGSVAVAGSSLEIPKGNKTPSGTSIDNDSDDITLGSFLKKRKASNLKKPKAKRSNPNPADNFGTEKLSEALRSVEVELASGKRKRSGMVAPKRWGRRTLFCCMNRNPADFTTPGPGNRFMRRADEFLTL